MTVELSASRAVPVEPDEAFTRLLPMPLETIFAHRYAALPPIAGTRDQTGNWDAAGQTRTVLMAGGGSMVEELTAVDEPRLFEYRLSGFAGPMKALVSTVNGSWSFVPAGTGVEITWRWLVEPKGLLGRAAMPAFAAMWRPYARRALETVSAELLRH